MFFHRYDTELILHTGLVGLNTRCSLLAKMAPHHVGESLGSKFQPGKGTELCSPRVDPNSDPGLRTTIVTITSTGRRTTWALHTFPIRLEQSGCPNSLPWLVSWAGGRPSQSVPRARAGSQTLSYPGAWGRRANTESHPEEHAEVEPEDLSKRVPEQQVLQASTDNPVQRQRRSENQ